MPMVQFLRLILTFCPKDPFYGTVASFLQHLCPSSFLYKNFTNDLQTVYLYPAQRSSVEISSSKRPALGAASHTHKRPLGVRRFICRPEEPILFLQLIFTFCYRNPIDSTSQGELSAFEINIILLLLAQALLGTLLSP